MHRFILELLLLEVLSHCSSNFRCLERDCAFISCSGFICLWIFGLLNNLHGLHLPDVNFPYQISYPKSPRSFKYSAERFARKQNKLQLLRSMTHYTIFCSAQMSMFLDSKWGHQTLRSHAFWISPAPKRGDDILSVYTKSGSWKLIEDATCEIFHTSPNEKWV